MPRQVGISTDESYWACIRVQYDIDPAFLNLEYGYFGAPARPVFDAYQRYQREVLPQNSFFLRQRWAPIHARVMDRLAAFSGASADELTVTRNLMESLNTVLLGYPFKPGDHAVHASHDYDEVVDALHRSGAAITCIDIPLDPESDEQIVALYEAAITPQTRLLLVTHMVHRTGQIMPVAKIATMARGRGVDVVADAAHSFAHLDYKITDLGADFVGVNLHKWLGAPLGVGMLYIRRERGADIKPLFAGGHVGTVPPEPIMAIEDAIAFHESIGGAEKEARLRYLKEYWLRRAQATVPGFVSLTPSDPQRACAIAAFRIEGMDSQEVVQTLMSRHGIFTVVRDIAGGKGVRITPNVFTSTAELDRLVSALAQLRPGG